MSCFLDVSLFSPFPFLCFGSRFIISSVISHIFEMSGAEICLRACVLTFGLNFSVPHDAQALADCISFWLLCFMLCCVVLRSITVFSYSEYVHLKCKQGS